MPHDLGKTNGKNTKEPNTQERERINPLAGGVATTKNCHRSTFIGSGDYKQEIKEPFRRTLLLERPQTPPLYWDEDEILPQCRSELEFTFGAAYGSPYVGLSVSTLCGMQHKFLALGLRSLEASGVSEGLATDSSALVASDTNLYRLTLATFVTPSPQSYTLPQAPPLWALEMGDSKPNLKATHHCWGFFSLSFRKDKSRTSVSAQYPPDIMSAEFPDDLGVSHYNESRWPRGGGY